MTQEKPPNLITVKLRKGSWEIEISCQESQLKQAIDSVLGSLSQENLRGKEMDSLDSTTPTNKTCRGLIIDLWQGNWFSKGRSLSEVDEEIARRGYHYDRTAVAHALTDLVRENKLTREGIARNYTYIQKRPPDESNRVDIGLEKSENSSEI